MKCLEQPIHLILIFPNWDISNVTNLSEIFRNADAFNRSIDPWDVSSVTNMSGMFRGTSIFNQSLSNLGRF